MITSNADAKKIKPTATKNTSALDGQGLGSESPDFMTKPQAYSDNLLNIVTCEDDEASQP